MGGKGGKHYRIAETRVRRVDRERDERIFDDTDVMQRASQIVMYVAIRTSDTGSPGLSVSLAVYFCL